MATFAPNPGVNLGAAFGAGGLAVNNNGNGLVGQTSAPISAIGTPYTQAAEQQIPYSQTAAGQAASRAASAQAAATAAARNDTNNQLNDTEADIMRRLSGVDQAAQIGLGTIADNFARDNGRAEQQQNQALAGYATQRVDNNQGRSDAYNNVDNNANNLNTSVRRILGLAGSSGSSAAKIAAPTLISNDASAKRTNVTGTFAKNDREIAGAEDKTKLSFANLFQDLLAQRKQKESEFNQGIETQRNAFRGQLAEVAGQRATANGGGYDQVRAAQAPLRAAIAAGDNTINSLAANARTSFNVAPVSAAAASIDPFAVDRTLINAQQETGAPSGGEAYAQQLRKRLQEGTLA